MDDRDGDRGDHRRGGRAGPRLRRQRGHVPRLGGADPRHTAAAAAGGGRRQPRALAGHRGRVRDRLPLPRPARRVLRLEPRDARACRNQRGGGRAREGGLRRRRRRLRVDVGGVRSRPADREPPGRRAGSSCAGSSSSTSARSPSSASARSRPRCPPTSGSPFPAWRSAGSATAPRSSTTRSSSSAGRPTSSADACSR